MKIITLLLTFLATSFAFASDDPAVVEKIDLQKYSGKWYEIAHSRNFFQRNCQRSEAEYGVLSATSLSVKNICFREDGSVKDISGTATVVDPAVPGKLKVRFNFFARGDYWITHLDPNYQWAVVSGPGRGSLFILARKGPMPQEQLQQLLETLKQQKFTIDNLVFDVYEKAPESHEWEI